MSSFSNLRKGFVTALVTILPIIYSGGSAAADIVVLDNDQPGTSSTGTWKVSSGASPYGSHSFYSGQDGATYTYRIDLATPGEYRVYARWTEWSSRRTSVPYEIRHLGGTSTIRVNQQQYGGQWRLLGNTWNFGQTASIRIRSLGNGTTSADAIKLVPVSGNLAPVVTTSGNPTVSEGGTLRIWVNATDSDGSAPTLSTGTLPANAVFIDNNNGTGVLSWPTAPGDAGDYSVTFIATDTSDPTITGEKTLAMSVTASNSSGGPVTLDNGLPGTSSAGNWKTSSGIDPYGSSSLYSGQSGDTYTYRINLAAPGAYQVYARWTEWPSRRTSVPYEISHLDGTSTVNVNQRQNGGQWRKLGGTWNFGSTATIRIRSLGNGTTSADAIRLVPASTAPATQVQAQTQKSAPPTTTARYLSEDFESSYWADKFSLYPRGNIFRESGTAARSGKYGIRIKITKGSHWGGRILFDHSRQGQEGNFREIWTRYYVRFGSNWGRNDERLGKAGFRVRSDEVCGAPCLEMTDGHELTSSGSIAGYSYFHQNVSNADISAKTYDYGRRNWNGQARTRERNQWYCVETHHVLNTPKQKNGVYQNWVNGVLVSDQRNIRQRDTSTLNIDSSVLMAYIGGNWVADRNMSIYFDDWAVSDKRIGCN